MLYDITLKLQLCNAAPLMKFTGLNHKCASFLELLYRGNIEIQKYEDCSTNNSDHVTQNQKLTA